MRPTPRYWISSHRAPTTLTACTNTFTPVVAPVTHPPYTPLTPLTRTSHPPHTHTQPAKEWELYNLWVARIEQEFYAQGDLEREADIPVTPIFDRLNPIPRAKLQVLCCCAAVLRAAQPGVQCRS